MNIVCLDLEGVMKRIKKMKTIAQLAAKTATRLVANCNLISRYSGIPMYHCRFYNTYIY